MTDAIDIAYLEAVAAETERVKRRTYELMGHGQGRTQSTTRSDAWR